MGTVEGVVEAFSSVVASSYSFHFTRCYNKFCSFSPSPLISGDLGQRIRSPTTVKNTSKELVYTQMDDV